MSANLSSTTFITLSLTPDQVRGILAVLGTRPYVEVKLTIESIERQANAWQQGEQQQRSGQAQQASNPPVDVYQNVNGAIERIQREREREAEGSPTVGRLRREAFDRLGQHRASEDFPIPGRPIPSAPFLPGDLS